MADLSYKVTVDTAAAEKNLTALKGVIAGLAGALSAVALTQFADSVTNLTNKLRVISKDAADVERQFAAVVEIANESRMSLDNVATLYSRVARSARDMGISQRDAAILTDTMAKALQISGATTAEASSAMLQLSQAFASGTLRGEELNAMLESAPVLAKILADSLGVTVGQLRKLGEQGKLTSSQVAQAFINANASITETFGKSVPTISQSFERVSNSLKVVIADVEKNTGIFASLANAIISLANSVKTFSTFVKENSDGILTLVKVLGSLVGAYLLVSTAVRTVQAVQSAAILAFGLATKSTGLLTGVLAGAARAATNFGKALGIIGIAANAQLTRIGYLIAGLGALTRSFLRLGGIIGIFYALAEAVDFALRKLGINFQILDSLGKAWDWIKEKLGIFQEEQAKTNEEVGKAIDQLDNQTTAVRRVIQATDEQKKSLRDITRAYEDSVTAQMQSLRVSNEAINATDEQRRLTDALLASEKEYFTTARRLEDELAAARKKAREEGGGNKNIKVESEYVNLLVKELQKLEKAYVANTLSIRDLVVEQTRLTNARQLYLFGVAEEQRQSDALLRIQRDIARTGMSEIEKKYEDIRDAADDAARAAIRAEEARRNAPLDTQEIEEYYRIARQGQERLIDLTRRGFEQSRTWSAGWRQAYREYADNATNAARRAQSIFQKTMQGMEDLLVNFVKTGKFEWKNFVSMMLEELLRAQIQQTFAQIFNPNAMTGQKGGFLDGIIGTIGSLFGAGGNQRGSSPGTPLYVMDISGGGGTGAFGFPVGGQQQGGGIMGILGSVGKTIGNVIGGVTGGIGKVIGGVVDTVGSIGKAIGGSGIGQAIGSVIDWGKNLFSGFFANGGMIPAGRFGIVGERGPEYVGGPAQVTPMPAQQVVYNINAVDAASFRQLIARDPGFIHAVAQQGARSVPQARS